MDLLFHGTGRHPRDLARARGRRSSRAADAGGGGPFACESADGRNVLFQTKDADSPLRRGRAARLRTQVYNTERSEPASANKVDSPLPSIGLSVCTAHTAAHHSRMTMPTSAIAAVRPGGLQRDPNRRATSAFRLVTGRL